MASRRGRFRTKLCRNYALGHCPQGDNCNYIHATPETIQSSSVAPGLQPSLSQHSYDDQLSASTFSPPLWPTLSPGTNASSEPPAYHWGPPSGAPAPAPDPASRMKYRSLAYRTTLCRHFVKNRGWCPLGAQCHYIHDLALAEVAKDDVRPAVRGRSAGRAGGGGGERSKAGSKHSHCWAYVQGLCHVHDCPYLHPAAAQLFAPHTPCLSWPNCRRGPLCQYKHPEPYISSSPPPSPPPETQTQHAALQMQEDAVPRGHMPFVGSYYFPMAPQAAPLPQPAPPPPPPPPPHPHQPSMPQQPQFSPTAVVFTNPWDTWHAAPFSPTFGVGFPMNMGVGMGMGVGVPYAPVFPFGPGHAHPAWPALSPIDPAGSGMAMFSAPQYPAPLSPPAYGSTAPPPAHELEPAYPATRPSFEFNAPVPQGGSEPLAFSLSPTRAAPEGEFDFPYVPPKHQQVGHARRVSVTIGAAPTSVNATGTSTPHSQAQAQAQVRSQSQSAAPRHEGLDALGLDSATAAAHHEGRMPWQTHVADRGARRSWAPPSSALRGAAQAMTPPPVFY